MPSDGDAAQLGVWLDADTKAAFSELAYQRRTNMSALARELVKQEVAQARDNGELDAESEASADD